MKLNIVCLLLGILLVISFATALTLNNVSDTEVSPECYQILKDKGITEKEVKLTHLFQKHGNDYWRILGGGLSLGFYTKADSEEKESEINKLKVEKIEEWCSEQTNKYEDVPLKIIKKK